VVLCSAVVAVLCAVSGFLASVAWSIPVGPSIVVANIICFACFFCIGKGSGR